MNTDKLKQNLLKLKDLFLEETEENKKMLDIYISYAIKIFGDLNEYPHGGGDHTKFEMSLSRFNFLNEIWQVFLGGVCGVYATPTGKCVIRGRCCNSAGVSSSVVSSIPEDHVL